ncbi:TetR-like C-terminal domain-containing protein, partial [Streptomyces halstedii]|uniref:TetR-like C-terminal domain-containing protein n=1 Tax=Streptomyces halstedii TaxID=1944 RepID=UPI003345348E
SRLGRTTPLLGAAARRNTRCRRFRGSDPGSLGGVLRVAARAAGEWAGRDSTQLLQGLGNAVMQDKELQQALRDALVEPEVVELRQMIARGVERGEIAADHPALEFVPAQMLGVLRVRPLLEGQYADAAYLTQFVEAVVLPALGLT